MIICIKPGAAYRGFFLKKRLNPPYELGSRPPEVGRGASLFCTRKERDVLLGCINSGKFRSLTQEKTSHLRRKEAGADGGAEEKIERGRGAAPVMFYPPPNSPLAMN